MFCRNTPCDHMWFESGYDSILQFKKINRETLNIDANLFSVTLCATELWSRIRIIWS